MKKFSRKQWIKFSIATVLYLLFTLWMQNPWLLLGELLIAVRRHHQPRSGG